MAKDQALVLWCFWTACCEVRGLKLEVINSDVAPQVMSVRRERQVWKEIINSASTLIKCSCQLVQEEIIEEACRGLGSVAPSQPLGFCHAGCVSVCAHVLSPDHLIYKRNGLLHKITLILNPGFLKTLGTSNKAFLWLQSVTLDVMAGLSQVFPLVFGQYVCDLEPCYLVPAPNLSLILTNFP